MKNKIWQQLFIVVLGLLIFAPTVSAETITWVPKFGSSSTCDVAALDDSYCSGACTWTENGMVTDEWSLIMMSVAAIRHPNATDMARFDGFY